MRGALHYLAEPIERFYENKQNDDGEDVEVCEYHHNHAYCLINEFVEFEDVVNDKTIIKCEGEQLLITEDRSFVHLTRTGVQNQWSTNWNYLTVSEVTKYWTLEEAVQSFERLLADLEPKLEQALSGWLSRLAIADKYSSK